MTRREWECECGHSVRHHTGGTGRCLVTDQDGNRVCGCDRLIITDFGSTD